VRHIEGFVERFPTIYASCLVHGIDPLTELIPVAPASHYASGGVRVDLNGHSSISGLYACGETACTGVHGANRLASNSLLEGLVFSARIAADIAANPREFAEPVDTPAPTILLDPKARKTLQASMSKGAGVLRSAHSLQRAEKDLEEIAIQRSSEPCVEAWETTNLFQLAQAIVRSALTREETRGSHWREDFPEQLPRWSQRILQRMDIEGNWKTSFEAVEES
jgi:L-aspartate oxidase